MELASEGASQPEMKVSFIDGRNHHGGSDTTVATTCVPKPKPIVSVGLRALSRSRVMFPRPSLVNCSMSGWIQHTASTTPPTAVYRSARRRRSAHASGARPRSRRSATARPKIPHAPSSGTRMT